MLNVGFDRSHLRAREDYLKAIYHLAGEGPVQAAELARYLGVSRSSVSQFKVRLAGERLIRRASERTDALRLTKKGLAMAIAIVRRHRLLETFLHRSLGVPLERGSNTPFPRTLRGALRAFLGTRRPIRTGIAYRTRLCTLTLPPTGR